MAELRRLDLAGVRKICPENYSNGLKYSRDGAVTATWRTSSALHASVKGSARQPYQASAGLRDDGSYWGRCSCPAARRQSICKHAVAVLVTWAERPDLFVLREEPRDSSEGKPKLESQVKRARAPKADRKSVLSEGLDKAELLLVDLASQGMVSVNRQQVETIGALAETLEAHKLRRLARQVSEIQRAAESSESNQDGFEERRWAALLCDAWFILSATRKALGKSDGSDQAELEELVGKTWLEKDLRRVEDLELIELACERVALPSGFRVETSYLVDLADGTLYTEKQITPTRLKDAPRKHSYALPLRVRIAGVYPGFPPHRVKLIEAEEAPPVDGLWDRVAELAETSVAALRQRLSQSTTSLVAPQEAYTLFKPASILARDGSLYLVDGEMKAVPVDGTSHRATYGLLGALRLGPLAAAFCRVRFTRHGMQAEPLSAILAQGRFEERLVRFSS